MERINPRFFYHLGALLKPLTQMRVENTSRMDIWLASRDVQSIVSILLDFYSALTVCRNTGLELIKAITDVADWVSEAPSSDWQKKTIR